MIVLKSAEDIEKIRKASRIVGNVLKGIERMVQPGVTTKELDKFAEAFIVQQGGRPAFKGYRGFKATLCTSVNEEVVHGIPSSRVLREGDIVGIDCGAIIEGFYGDAARTFPVGKIDQETADLLKRTREGLDKGVQAIQDGNRLGDVSSAIQACGDSYRYGIVRDFVGHGIGRALHEDPQVPNFGQSGTGLRLKPGLVLAIEPMFNIGTEEVKVLDDGWTVVTKDGKRSAHFENTVALTENGPEVLSEI